MKNGKLSTELLEKLVLSKLPAPGPDVLMGPRTGEDCAVVDFGDSVCVLSTDPITGSVRDIGKLAVHISVNDIASNGVKPLGMLFTVLLPTNTTEMEIEALTDDLTETCRQLNVSVLGGHTEVTAVVNQPVVSAVAIGRQPKADFLNRKKIQAGMDLLVTKTLGLEGTAVLCRELEATLVKKLGAELVAAGAELMNSISVLRDGLMAGSLGVTGMHDITEGGLLGAVWEMVRTENLGARVYGDDLPILPVTEQVAGVFGLDVLRLISSGSMLMAAENGTEIARTMTEQGIPTQVVGKVLAEPRLEIEQNGQLSTIEPPRQDELYRALMMQEI